MKDLLISRSEAGRVVVAVDVAVLLVLEVAQLEDGGEAGEDGIRGRLGNLHDLKSQPESVELRRRKLMKGKVVPD